MMQFKIAVILLNYNSSADCKKCIGFLQKLEKVDTEIVVVDNCSYKDDRDAAEALCQERGCTFIANKENKGYNAGNNVGLRYAAEKGYEYALIANPDMEFPQTDYLKCMVDMMESDEHIAVCGSDIITPEGIHQNPMKKDGDWLASFGWLTGYFRKKPNGTNGLIDDFGSSHYCHKLSGCCLLLRNVFVKEIGFFDEYPFLYREEAILSKQVDKSGRWKMYYIADIQAVHRHVKNEKGNPIPRFRQWKRSCFYYIDHYGGDPWWGKLLAKSALSLYTTIMIVATKIKGIIHHG